MINKILIYVFSVLLTLAVGYGIYSYIQLEKLRRELYDTENELFTEEQNSLAYQDRLEMTEDSIQSYAVEVGNLRDINKELEEDSGYWYTKHNKLLSKYSDLENKYFILVSDYQIIFDKVFAEGIATPIFVGNLIVVPFNGKHKTVTYNGKTTYNVQDSTGAYEISIVRAPMGIENNISLVGEEEELTLLSEIYADGELITNAKTVVDSSVYILLRRGLPDIKEETFWDRLKVGGGLAFYNSDITQVSFVDQYKLNMYLQGEYNFNNTISVYFNKTLFDKAFSIGGQYLIPTSEIFK